MSLRTSISGFLLLAALGVRADEPGTPLENSRQELKALKTGKTTHEGEAPAGKLRDALPHLLAPGSGSMPVEPLVSQKVESGTKGKKDIRNNWLLEGMDKLEKDSSSNKRRAKDRLTGAKSETADLNDPDYLLKLYRTQKNDSEEKAEAKQSMARRNDPLTPFLQGWLADSPGREKFFDEFIKRPNLGTGISGTPTPALQESVVDQPLTNLNSGGPDLRHAQGGAVPGQANPYLQGLDITALYDTVSHDRQSAVPAMTQHPLMSFSVPEPPARQSEKRLQLPAQSDDQKYFPQLKKF